MPVTSKDVLLIVISFCVLWLSIFLGWLLWYVISIVRDISRLLDKVTNVVDRVDSLTRAIHDKFESGAASFALFSTAIKEVVGWAIRERAAKKAETVHHKKKVVEEEENDEA